MKRTFKKSSAGRKAFGRAMDVTMIATTIGCAAAANMIHPGTGSVIVGALLGIAVGLMATRRA
ncbi:hypothetical protein [Pseudomonas sp.]|uniref:hypothetical protein n=1 Tax=Pseudomonas sp. TaxID=306 RepID=UPI002626FA18|nr:hypothetical protein [Pseudomonas sp.]